MSDLGAVDAVCFDLDDTLCTYRRGGPELLAAAVEAVGVEPPFTYPEYEARYDEFLDEAASIEELRERCFAALAADAGRDPSIGRELAAAYAAERDHANVRALPGVTETLSALSDRQLALVTNGPPTDQRSKVEGLGIVETFETIVYAGHDIPAKPDPEPFERALSALDCAPDRAIHVGNSLTSDVAGANAAGLSSVWVPADSTANAGDETPDLRLDSLSSLPELLGSR